MHNRKVSTAVLPSFLIFATTFTFSFISASLSFVPKESSAAESSTQSDISVNINSTISLTLDSETVDLVLSPSVAETQTTQDVLANVSTNNPTGYHLGMSTITENTALIHTNNTNTIPSNTNSSAATLPVNTWGYNLGPNAVSFLAIPPLSAPATIVNKTTPAANDVTPITVGAKIDTTLPAGTYTNTLQFTAVTNLPPPPEAPTGTAMQLIGTDYSCPTTRTRLVDARDNATYWIQKLPDGKCWMLTNLAYAGGGTNTYNDTKTITNSETQGYGAPYYMIPTGSNKTVEPQDPSTSTTGIGQYGYLYNWCAAMGGQTTTSACMNAITPLPNQNISICPSGWRLPTGGTGGEYQALATAIGATNDTALKSSWLGMYSGYWSNGFVGRGSYGYYWSSTQNTPPNAYVLHFSSSVVYPGTYGSFSKQVGIAVRCLAL